MNNELINLEFEGRKLDYIIREDGEPLFELYNVGMMLGYSRKNGVGIDYSRKDRIDKIVENAEITVFSQKCGKYINLNGLRKFISMSNTRNKSKFIEFLQDKGYLCKEEVFEYSRKENVLMDSLNKILKPMGYTLETQRQDNNYRLDGYIPELDLVIEYDENSHNHYDLDKEHTRELYIKDNYSYLIRLTDSNDLMTNIGKIMNKIMEVYKKCKIN